MPIIEPAAVVNITISNKAIDGLTATILGTKPARKANREKSIAAFVKAFNEHGLGGEAEALSILQAPGEEIAEGELDAAMNSSEALGDDVPPVSPPPAPKEPSPRHAERTTKDDGMKVNGGKNADNPYRPRSKSYESFKLIQDNPGITRAEYVKAGGRTRLISHMVAVGQIRING